MMADWEARYRFSEQFGIARTKRDDWFDALLPVDTELFVDPFLIYADRDERWSAAHRKLLDFFNYGIELLEHSMSGPRFNRQSAHYRAAQRLFLFPEPAEFCLGYGRTPRGTGAGYVLRAALLDAAETAIRLGIHSLDHWEELALFRDQIGPDRISDVTCNILKGEFLEYTKDVIEAKGLIDQTERLRVDRAVWSRDSAGWQPRAENLLRNSFTGLAILLVPERFLRKLPNVDPEDFWEWSWSYESDDIKGQFNYDIGRGIRRSKEIARFAARNAHLVRRYLGHLERDPKEPYPVEEDPRGEVTWYDAASQVATALSLPPVPTGEPDFCRFVEGLVDEFSHAVEDRGLWGLLWVQDRPRQEKYVQLLFSAVMYGFCKSHNIDMSPESNAGSGPVDFKFSQGWKRRAAIELKLTKNSRYWNGLKRQIVQYLKAEGIPCGYFVSVHFTENDMRPERRATVEATAADVSKESGKKIAAKFVNARRRPPASKL